jgi:CHAT domain-containing protein
VAAVTAGRAGSSCRVDAAATRQALLSAIGHYDRVHLAGHAQASISFPLASHLILADGTVTIQDVLSELPDATSDLGVLSCCVGALGGAPVPTGGVTFAGVLLATCFRRVIGSLWRLRDDYTALVTAKIHSLIDEGVDSALALRQAQLFLRSAPGLDVHRFAKAAGIDDRWMDQSRADVLSWGPLVHFG